MNKDFKSDNYKNNLRATLIESEELFKISFEFINEATDPMFIIDENGNLLYNNKACESLLSDWCCIIGGKVPKKISSKVKGLEKTKQEEFTFNQRLYDFTIVPVDNNNVFFIYGNDITEKREIENHLNRLAKIIDETINILYITDYNGNIEYINKTFEKVTGYTKDEVIGKNPKLLASGDTDPSEYKNMWETIKKGNTWRGLLKNKKKDGSNYWVNGFITPIRDEDGNITNFLAIQEDVTEKIEVKEQLSYLTKYDKITGTINRERFIELLNEYLSDPMVNKEGGALLQINIDGFKLINDSFGYIVGDRFLKSFADFLVKKISDMDVVSNPNKESILSRIGGDEFGIFLVSKNKEESMKAAEYLRKSIEEETFLNNSIRTTVSIGVALYPEQGQTSTELLAKAGAAISNARIQGRNRYFMFQENDSYFENAESILEEKQLIIKAVEEDRFVPWFQPILDLNTNEIKYYEALARLELPDKKVLAPGSFIPTAERYGLISEVDRLITEKSIKKQAECMKQGRDISVSMNLSGKHLEDEEMLNYLQNTLKVVGADPKYITFEITETAAINNLSSAVNFVKKLKELGCKFSLDDFGVGFTSFVHLIEMNVDYLKIDGSFIRNLPDNERNRVLVKSISEMSKSLGIKTIAEFVESDATIDILKSTGIDFAQGYLVGRPSPEI